MGTFIQDLRYGIRVMAKNWGFTLIAVIALALGIGANSAIFSVVNAVLLRPLPFKDPDRIVIVSENNFSKGYEQFAVSPPNFADWRDQNQVFEHIAAVRSTSFNITGSGEPERLRGVRTSASFFDLLGVQPLFGRGFLPEEDQPGRDNVAAISYGLWQRRFGGDPNLVGQSISLNSRPYTVIAVMPPEFQTPGRSEVWVPIAFGPDDLDSRGAHYVSVFARVNKGTPVEQARSEMQTIAARLEQQYPDTNTGWGVNVVPLIEAAVGDIRPTLMLLFGAVAFVLLIACANVANLLLARATARHKEIAIRTALGAGRMRLIRQLLTESLLLSLLGGVLGLVVGYWGVRLLIAASPDTIPRSSGIGLDGWVFGFTLGISLLTGVLFGLAPALSASKIDLNESLKEGGRTSSGGGRRQYIRNLLVVTEVALALILLIGAGLMIKSFLRLQQVDPGFNPRNVMTMVISLPGAKYREGHQQVGFFQQLLERVEALPGVEAATVCSTPPLSNNDFIFGFVIEGRPPASASQTPSANYYAISHDYFRAIGIPLLRGRYFTPQDNQNSARVAIINETMARRYFPGEDPVGKRVFITNGPEVYREIVGVVGDVKHYSLTEETRAQVYEPYLQYPLSSLTLAVRTATDPAAITGAVRAQVLDIDKDQPVSNIRTMEQMVADTVVQSRLMMLLLAVFAGVALVLSSVGLYGVMSYSVTQRTREIGIRMALGAQRRDVVRMVVGQGMVLASVGLAVGVLGALALTRLMASLLYEVSATDPATFIAISLMLAIVAALASYIPARKAMRVDPMVALRYE